MCIIRLFKLWMARIKLLFHPQIRSINLSMLIEFMDNEGNVTYLTKVSPKTMYELVEEFLAWEDEKDEESSFLPTIYKDEQDNDNPTLEESGTMINQLDFIEFCIHKQYMVILSDDYVEKKKKYGK